MSDIKLHNDDCMNVLPSLADRSISLTLTDIPYDEVNKRKKAMAMSMANIGIAGSASGIGGAVAGLVGISRFAT